MLADLRDDGLSFSLRDPTVGLEKPSVAAVFPSEYGIITDHLEAPWLWPPTEYLSP